ncbi:putative RNA polymerase sigma factor HI_1459 [Rubrivivax sp. A210]|uniref:sigma-70 family RNA polymerase sigma factor n=1 Tax=Rubrivivax sp. A210 TaxID=2772301 RepID=UPI0019183F80|nr:sigma-70 family RNA polymerase sigma factor [Rubrivivax sp. A210]CAD5371623.1 putative RNA polymerase sigma factor HI_1459 [Rubrivivax sp. A210]
MTLDQQLVVLRTPLLRYAQLQLRDAALAEDAVSETLLAILERPEGFAGASSLRTYATAILKHKLVDTLRRRGRELPLEPLDEQSLDEAIDAHFRADGHWDHKPQPWGQPEAVLHQAQFLEVLQSCIDRLPPRLARIFMAREWLELEVAEICDEMQITSSNCGVMLYRARMQLRGCLEQRWIGQS